MLTLEFFHIYILIKIEHLKYEFQQQYNYKTKWLSWNHLQAAQNLTKLQNNKTIIDSRLCPRCHTLTNSTKHCSCLTSNWHGNVFRDSAHQSLVAQYENLTSSAIPKVHNISQRRQRRTELRPQATCKKFFVKFMHVVFELWEQPDRHITILCYPTGQSNYE